MIDFQLIKKFSFWYSAAVLVFIPIFLLFSWDIKPVIIWLFMSVAFYPLFFASIAGKHLTLIFFICGLFVAHGIGSPLFFIDKESYTRSGFSAVKDFDFNVLDYLKIYTGIFFYIYFTVVFTLLIKSWIRTKSFDFRVIKSNVEEKAAHTKKGGLGYDLLLVVSVILLASLNFWMFNRGIGLTGVQPPRLPFKLSGILYFFTRFVAPILILYIYSKTKKSFLISCLIMCYALLAAVTQVSRTTLTMFYLPILFYCVIDKKYFRLAFSMVVFFSFFPFIEFARNFTYQIEAGVVGLNDANSLFSILQELADAKDVFAIKSSIIGFIGRLGGTQDVVLAVQYNNESFGNFFSEFSRVFGFPNAMDIVQVQSELFDFIPAEGFSPGDGAISASVLMIAGNNPLGLIVVSLFISMLLHFQEILLHYFYRRVRLNEVTIFCSLLFCMILVPRLNIYWLYGFMIVEMITIYVFSHSAFQKFVRRKLKYT